MSKGHRTKLAFSKLESAVSVSCHKFCLEVAELSINKQLSLPPSFFSLSPSPFLSIGLNTHNYMYTLSLSLSLYQSRVLESSLGLSLDPPYGVAHRRKLCFA